VADDADTISLFCAQGVSDQYSWIPGVFEAEGAALMWDDAYQKKSAYYGFLEGIETGGM
jgi:endo-1,4-beta-xylanase